MHPNHGFQMLIRQRRRGSRVMFLAMLPSLFNRHKA